MRHFGLGLALVFVFLALIGSPAYAGGGPENVFLVVNPLSTSSLTVANHYIALRKIPHSNVMYLEWKGSMETIDVDTFRKEFLQPVLKMMESRTVAAQIDYLIYSTDFPFRVDFRKDLPEGQQVGKWEFGSLTGMTYLVQPVINRNVAAYRTLTSNQYMRRGGPAEGGKAQAFRSWYGWSGNGEVVEGGGNHYLLSAMLGYTSGKGNTVAEVLNYLNRAAQSDGTHPKGTVYFCQSTDSARSGPRHDDFPEAVAALKELGVAGEVIKGPMPMNKPDVVGCMMGVAKFDWAKSGSTILPGAFCDHLTSYAGILSNPMGQTPLTEYLRFGAAGSCGTVIEPTNPPQKFPSPFLHVWYASGCSLAEAFYQSVHGPYQQLLVGDPLCRPWAHIPEISVEGVAADEKVKGTLTIKPAAKTTGTHPVERFELFLDGAAVARCNAGESMELETTLQSDGHHELRIVGTESGPIETQGMLLLPVQFANHGREMTLDASAKAVKFGQSLTLTAAAPKCRSIVFYSNGRILGRKSGDHAQLQVDTKTLGEGPLVMKAIGLGASGATTHVLAAPVEVTIQGDQTAKR